MDPKALYLLIAVTNGGEVRLTHDIRGLEQCETVRSLALYGMTPGEIQDEASRIKQAERAADERWSTAHPPRRATASDLSGCQPLNVLYSSAYGCKLLADGMAVDVQPMRMTTSELYNPSHGEAIITVAGRQVKRYAGDARTASCVPDEAKP